MLSWILVIALIASPTLATIATNWTNPPARDPTFSSNYIVGERIWLSWQPLNQSSDDLWLRRYDTSEDDFSLRIASALDISVASSFPWTISIPEDEILKDTRFMFVFVPQNSNFDVESTSDLESPGFNIMLVNQATPPNGTVASVTSTAVTTSSVAAATTSTFDLAPSSTPPPDPPSISMSTITGIAVGVVAAVGLAGFFIGYAVFKKRQRKSKSTDISSELPASGPYEVLGSSTLSVEVENKEMRVHEMSEARDGRPHESDSSLVHEVGNTIKRPGVHEMPG